MVVAVIHPSCCCGAGPFPLIETAECCGLQQYVRSWAHVRVR